VDTRAGAPAGCRPRGSPGTGGDPPRLNRSPGACPRPSMIGTNERPQGRGPPGAAGHGFPLQAPGRRRVVGNPPRRLKRDMLAGPSFAGACRYIRPQCSYSADNVQAPVACGDCGTCPEGGDAAGRATMVPPWRKRVPVLTGDPEAAGLVTGISAAGRKGGRPGRARFTFLITSAEPARWAPT